jgi:5-methylcytosine-specific restriction protein A
MPNRAKRPCTYPGCTALVESGRCDKHRAQVSKLYNKQRGSSADRGYDSRWRKARDRYLREHPLCNECFKNNQVTAATIVDHIEPHKGNHELFWDESNWQSLCKHHHDTKTASEDGGFGNVNNR